MSEILNAGKFAGGEIVPMSQIAKPDFFPIAGPPRMAEPDGFRLGDKGTHSSRTIMLTEVSAVFDALPRGVDQAAYVEAIVDANCLQKTTTATRRASSQRLSELYALDPRVPLFRVFRNLWIRDPEARPQLAILTSIARDPLLRSSAPAILSQPIGAEIHRAPIRDSLRSVVGERMNDATVDKVVRNVLSSWTQSGHLKGRTFKIRQRVQATPASLAYALWLGQVAGFRGDALLTSGWVVVLDCSAGSALGLAQEAKRLGMIDLRSLGDVTEFGLDRLDPGFGGH